MISERPERPERPEPPEVRAAPRERVAAIALLYLGLALAIAGLFANHFLDTDIPADRSPARSVGNALLVIGPVYPGLFLLLYAAERLRLERRALGLSVDPPSFVIAGSAMQVLAVTVLFVGDVVATQSADYIGMWMLGALVVLGGVVWCTLARGRDRPERTREWLWVGVGVAVVVGLLPWVA